MNSGSENTRRTGSLNHYVGRQETSVHHQMDFGGFVTGSSNKYRGRTTFRRRTSLPWGGISFRVTEISPMHPDGSKNNWAASANVDPYHKYTSKDRTDRFSENTGRDQPNHYAGRQKKAFPMMNEVNKTVRSKPEFRSGRSARRRSSLPLGKISEDNCSSFTQPQKSAEMGRKGTKLSMDDSTNTRMPWIAARLPSRNPRILCGNVRIDPDGEKGDDGRNIGGSQRGKPKHESSGGHARFHRRLSLPWGRISQDENDLAHHSQQQVGGAGNNGVTPSNVVPNQEEQQSKKKSSESGYILPVNDYGYEDEVEQIGMGGSERGRAESMHSGRAKRRISLPWVGTSQDSSSSMFIQPQVEGTGNGDEKKHTGKKFLRSPRILSRFVSVKGKHDARTKLKLGSSHSEVSPAEEERAKCRRTLPWSKNFCKDQLLNTNLAGKKVEHEKRRRGRVDGNWLQRNILRRKGRNIISSSKTLNGINDELAIIMEVNEKLNDFSLQSGKPCRFSAATSEEKYDAIKKNVHRTTECPAK